MKDFKEALSPSEHQTNPSSIPSRSGRESTLRDTERKLFYQNASLTCFYPRKMSVSKRDNNVSISTNQRIVSMTVDSVLYTTHTRTHTHIILLNTQCQILFFQFHHYIHISLIVFNFSQSSRYVSLLKHLGKQRENRFTDLYSFMMFFHTNYASLKNNHKRFHSFEKLRTNTTGTHHHLNCRLLLFILLEQILHMQPKHCCSSSLVRLLC